MAVPANPTLTQVCAEFLAPSNTPLSHFRRGAGWVPDVPQNANVPTSLPLHLSQLAGAVRYVPVSATKSGNANGSVFLPHSGSPANVTVTSNPAVVISPSGGTGSYSCTWSHVSGDSSISTPGANLFSVSFSASVGRNNEKTAVKRCTVTDGQSSTFVDVSVTLSYTTDV